MDIVICFFLLATALYIEIVIHKISDLKIELSKIQIEKSIFIKKFHNKKNDMPSVSFKPGKFYAYDALNKVIRYEEKEMYSCYDFFALSHEIGHLQDDKSNRILCFAIMKVMERLFFLPLYILLCVLKIKYGFILSVGIVGIMFLLLALFHLYFIHKYEKSASDYALDIVEEFDELYLCKKFAKLCIKQQFLIEIIEMEFVVLLTAVVI